MPMATFHDLILNISNDIPNLGWGEGGKTSGRKAGGKHKRVYKPPI